jgi:(1->4)-alpha-D-glucan 1-alpha-D-glucosylmutase
MGVDSAMNSWWRDVLENGPASPFASYFDIDWEPVKPELRNKVLLPILGDHYGHVLERGELKMEFADGALIIKYCDRDLPIDPKQWPRVFRLGLDGLKAGLPEDDPALVEFLSILTALDHLPATHVKAPEQVAERQREKKVARERLVRLLDGAPIIRKHIDETLAANNGIPGKPETFDHLHELLENLPYRLAYWRTAFHEINYRRFFDINDLAGICMDNPAVFAAAHDMVFRLIREGKITGLRLDHLDGLFDPTSYLHQLQRSIAEPRAPAAAGRRADTAAAERAPGIDHEPAGVSKAPFYVVVEKILTGGETLPDDWPIYGTTGYDFLNDLTRLFVEPQNARALKRVYQRFTNQSTPLSDIVCESKEIITATAMASELNVLAHALNRLSEGNRRARDFTLDSLREALRQTVACFPVYRTYVTEKSATDSDRQVIDMALTRARRRNPAMEPTVFAFLRDCLLPPADTLTIDEARQRLNFSMRFQQYTGPVQAKGLEDTAFYRYNVLLSLNEVGGDPQRFGGTAAQFHESNKRRRSRWPLAMLATATHDTKRGEDVRARLNVLSEIPDEWRRCLSAWARSNGGLRVKVDGAPAPDRNDEYLLYQALLGSWPADPGGTISAQSLADLTARLQAYLLKAVKEAKVHTSWINPNEAYDQAVVQFVARVLTGPRAERFRAAFLPFQQRVALLGVLNSLSHVLLKITSPGIPDFYQGTELWDLSLVDPDNRRPVDYAVRRRMLEELAPALSEPAMRDGERGIAAKMLDSWEDGRIKMYVTAQGLRLRKRWPRLFLEGDYEAPALTGERADNLVAVLRRHEGKLVVSMVPRLVARWTSNERPWPMGESLWKNTCVEFPEEMRPRHLRNVLTGETPAATDGKLKVAEVLSSFPLALLEGEC